MQQYTGTSSRIYRRTSLPAWVIYIRTTTPDGIACKSRFGLGSNTKTVLHVLSFPSKVGTTLTGNIRVLMVIVGTLKTDTKRSFTGIRYERVVYQLCTIRTPYHRTNRVVRVYQVLRGVYEVRRYTAGLFSIFDFKLHGRDTGGSEDSRGIKRCDCSRQRVSGSAKIDLISDSLVRSAFAQKRRLANECALNPTRYVPTGQLGEM